jgi:hypothetical protein
MTQSSKDEIYKKWAPILNNIGITGSKADWFSEYAEIHSKNEVSEQSDFPSIFPMATKIAAQTIGLDIVTVQPLSAPMGMGNSEEERKRIEAEIKSENREGKIESVLEGKEYKEKTIKDHPDYKEGTGLFYLDFKYNSGKKTRRAGKKHKKK